MKVGIERRAADRVIYRAVEAADRTPRFRASGAAGLATEESIYLGGGQVRRAEQLVVTGQVKDASVEIAWLFEQAKAV